MMNEELLFHDKHRKIFKCLVGSHNYGVVDGMSDEDYKTFVFPTFDDLYLERSYSFEKTTTISDHTYHDIRRLPILLYKSSINHTEILFTKKRETYLDLFELEDLFALREQIARVNLPQLLSGCKGMCHRLYRKSVDPQLPIFSRGKANASIYRIFEFISNYADNNFQDFGKCIEVVQKDHYFKLRHVELPKELEANANSSRIIINSLDKYVNVYNKKPNLELLNEMNQIVKKSVSDYILFDRFRDWSENGGISTKMDMFTELVKKHKK